MPAARKRKSDAATSAGKSKKARAVDPHAKAIALVNAILSDPDEYEIPEDEDVIRDSLVELAQYARDLEGQVASGSTAAPQKTKEQIEAEVEKLRRAANAGIRKQMGWKPSCKTGSAKWAYDGICSDPIVFGALMGLDGPPTWKTKKFPRDDFEDLLGAISASVRYDVLEITSKDVNVRWSDSGEFKFSGSYGKHQPERDV
ncbi:hypothetical protein NLI96_g1219 [Meripilus lineatus]|uniref:Uncharacterized protein n=1 Tax=Meripilus lineatus TaxID=2056292 RepID=A0AAD5VAL1_9APHY|nr:hypothetical protein NLI96_g1219 [Physisporinus lineatus]